MTEGTNNEQIPLQEMGGGEIAGLADNERQLGQRRVRRRRLCITEFIADNRPLWVWLIVLIIAIGGIATIYFYLRGKSELEVREKATYPLGMVTPTSTLEKDYNEALIKQLGAETQIAVDNKLWSVQSVNFTILGVGVAMTIFVVGFLYVKFEGITIQLQEIRKHQNP